MMIKNAGQKILTEERASIAELKTFYVKAEGITKVYPLETLTTLFATGGLGGSTQILSCTSAASGIIGTAANYGFQRNNQSTDWMDVGIAGTTGFLTAGRNLWSTMTINTSGALIGSTIKGEDPYPGMTGAMIGTLVGYKIRKAIEVPLNNKLNPWYRPDWIQESFGVSRWNTPNAWPAVWGSIGSSFVQEPTGNSVKNGINTLQKNKSNEKLFFYVFFSSNTWLWHLYDNNSSSCWPVIN